MPAGVGGAAFLVLLLNSFIVPAVLLLPQLEQKSTQVQSALLTVFNQHDSSADPG